MDQDRLLRQVDPSHGVERVGVGSYNFASIGTRKLRYVREDVGGLSGACGFDQHERVGEDVSALCDFPQVWRVFPWV